jgi:ABC-2 type transport system permease protein
LIDRPVIRTVGLTKVYRATNGRSSRRKLGGFHWLQTLVLINPLIYVTEGMRAGLTSFSHMPLYVIYPVLLGFCVAFMALGLRNFRRRVLV